jgi:peptide deformylase
MKLVISEKQLNELVTQLNLNKEITEQGEGEGAPEAGTSSDGEQKTGASKWESGVTRGAANQIGVNLRAFAYHVDGVVGHLINPEILEQSGELVELDEGCLSLPEIWSKTPRYTKVTIRGQTITGEVLEIQAEGLLAQVFQHEVDHLDGLVYLDRLNSQERKVCMESLRQTSWFMRD